ncbi:hypothetical protein PoB_007479100 [Plakobranchus ocellatus]|uniref:Uncharacterized protein n=1 Tax=Plakobranchus ocellatus TaxID=259542 RepID=A0AAV4DWS0_9GAST|nr:hypothetical protein PoB_007479100 [Plakobranchus ocellatus]
METPLETLSEVLESSKRKPSRREGLNLRNGVGRGNMKAMDPGKGDVVNMIELGRGEEVEMMESGRERE